MVYRLARSDRTFRLDRLDIATALLGLALLGAILITVGLGDRVGLRVRRYTPENVASSQPTIQITFDEPIDTASLPADALLVTPSVSGTLRAEGNALFYTVDAPLTPGQTYAVTLRAGLRANTGRALLGDFAWQFRIRTPQVVYLGPVDNIVQNLYSADPAQPDAPHQQLTFSPQGVIGFDVSRDGNRIAFAELTGQGTASLYAYDTRSGQVNTLLECRSAACTNPVWQPGGTMLAYERAELNLETGLAPGLPRIWLLDLAANQTRPLFADSQRVGYAPRWSPDGALLASYGGNDQGIVVVNIADGSDRVISTPQGEVGQFSPDGRWLFFPRIVQITAGGDSKYVAHFVLADLQADPIVQTDLVPEGDANNDVEAAWLTDSQRLVIARRPAGSTGVQGAQLYLIDRTTREAVPLVTDAAYSHGSMSVSPDGAQLAFQRFALGQPGARPEIWTYNLETQELRRAAENATTPRWLP